MKSLQHYLKEVILLILICVQGSLLAQDSIVPAKQAAVAVIKNVPLSSSENLFNLLSFTGVSSGEQNTLSWKTDGRSHFTGFTLERSINELEFFPIGHVDISGSNRTNSFTYADGKPVRGRNFYRLKMIDSTGKSTYSAIVSISYNPVSFLQIQFDSQTGTVGLTGMETGGQYQLKVYNCNGQLMLQKTVTPAIATISIGQLSHGLYVVYATDGTNAPVSQKIIW